jgi:L-amino acid N-acyltransferase YncA
MGVAPGFVEHEIGRELASQILRYYEKHGIRVVHTSIKWNDGGRLTLFKTLGFERSEFMNLTKKPNQT